MTGLITATVHYLESDKAEHAGKIEISIRGAGKDGQDLLLWAQLSGMYSGACFYPEIGDEVIVGFLNNMKDAAVILGSTVSKNNITPANNNYQKGFFSHNRLSFCFDDDKKTIQIQTPGGNSILLSDDKKTIELKDQNGNHIFLSDNGIELKSYNNITLNALGDIEIKAVGNITTSATQNISVTGSNIEQTASIGFVAKGNATAELSASGQTTVKGGIIMIN